MNRTADNRNENRKFTLAVHSGVWKLLSNVMDSAAILRLLNSLDAYVLELDAGFRIRTVSGGLIRRLGLTPADLAGQSAMRLFPLETFQELFVRGGVGRTTLKNFRAWLRTGPQTPRMLAQISGRRVMSAGSARGADGERFRLLIQDITPPTAPYPELGDYSTNLRAFQLVKRYINRHVWSRAQSAARADLTRIPDEEREFTFLFADLVSFTALAEKSSPAEVVAMLNLSIGATSSTIVHSGGFVDKIMGDSIFAVFLNPLDALIASIEIQKQFNILNLFRLKQDQDEVSLRVGIHTGKCLMATIGSDEFMELTFIGDAVNSASRLERACVAGAILASDATIALVREHVEISHEETLHVKGKTQPLHACYVNRVSFDGPRGPVSLGLDDSIF